MGIYNNNFYGIESGQVGATNGNPPPEFRDPNLRMHTLTPGTIHIPSEK